MPAGLEFRKELIWAKVQIRKKNKSKNSFLRKIAAMLVIGLGLIFALQFRFSEVSEDLVTSSSLKFSNDSVKPKVFETNEPEKLAILENLKSKELSSQKITADSGFLSSVSKQIPSQKTDNSRLIPSLEIANHNQIRAVSNEKEALSPAASRLKQTLKKIKKDQKIEETLVIEKFNLRKELNQRAFQATSKSNDSPVLDQLLKKRNENN